MMNANQRTPMILDGHYMTTDGQTDTCSRKYAVPRESMKLELIYIEYINVHWIESHVTVNHCKHLCGRK